MKIVIAGAILLAVILGGLYVATEDDSPAPRRPTTSAPSSNDDGLRNLRIP